MYLKREEVELETNKCIRRIKGLKELESHRASERLTQGEAVLAKCARCMSRYKDGRQDCRVPDCPLYPWMPFGSKQRPGPRADHPVFSPGEPGGLAPETSEE